MNGSASFNNEVEAGQENLYLVSVNDLKIVIENKIAVI